jgi:hypothetical protein
MPSPPNRQAITSYDRIQPGAPYHGYFNNSWQAFTAQSNTITQLGVTVGNPSAPSGATVTIRLCTNQPDVNGNCNSVGETNPQITNYGATLGDIGDVAVSVGATYWIDYFQPAIGHGGWVTYWWAGGGSISQSDQMQASAKGYNR